MAGTEPRGLERFTDLPIALGVGALGKVLSLAGPAAAYRFAALAGDAWHAFVPGRRHLAHRNLEIAFRGALGARERGLLARECCRHAAATAVDVLIRDGLASPENVRELVRVDPVMEDALRRPRPRGLVVLSAHLGSWEMLHRLVGLLGHPASAVARRIHNPHLDRLFTRLRTGHRTAVIPKEGALRGVARVLREGGIAGLMTDQSAPPGEGWFPFFGAPAATYRRYALLLARLEPEVVFAACLREGFSFRFRIVARDLTAALRGPGSEEERADRLVGMYLAALESAIAAAPEQHLWMHRRWKRRPPGATDLYRDLGKPLDPRLLEEASLPTPAFPPATEPPAGEAAA